MARNTKQYDQIHVDLYNKVNACTTAVTALTTELKTLKAAMSAETTRYVDLLHRQQDKQFRIIGCLFLAILFCIGIIGYGAIGQKGMYTVRNTMPTTKPHCTDTMPYIPPNDQDILPAKIPIKSKNSKRQ